MEFRIKGKLVCTFPAQIESLFRMVLRFFFGRSHLLCEDLAMNDRKVEERKLNKLVTLSPPSPRMESVKKRFSGIPHQGENLIKEEYYF